jgi:3-oxoacyl-[acyl-carrier protein] reductase
MRALVTGGTRGIGLAVVERLSRDGYQVWGTGRSEEAPATLAALGVAYLQADFGDPSDMDKLCDQVAALGFDVVVNSAGINRVAPLLELSAEDFNLVFAVNVQSAFRLCQATIPSMLAEGYGRICNVSSIWGMKGSSGRAAYSTSKFALRGLTVAIAAEFSNAGVLANCIAPGFVDTDLTRSVLGVDGIARVAQQVPVGRLGTPAEIADAIAWMISPANTYMTGQTVTIDGGFLGA